MLKRWFTVAALLASALPLRALDGKLFFTLAPNVADEFAHIMPYRPPLIPTVGRCVRNQPVTLVLVLKNPAVGKDGKVLVEIESVKTTEPNGKTKELVEPGKTVTALEGVKKNDRDFSGVMLSNFYLEMIVEDADPLGKTSIMVKLRDRGDNSTLTLVAEIEAVEKLPGVPKKTMTAEAMSKFMTDYYKAPDPAKIPAAFAAFLGFDEESSGGKKRSCDPLMWLCGFAELYKLNPQLRPALVKGAADYSTVHKKYVALILAQAGAGDSDLKDADPELRKLFAKVRGKSPLSFRTVAHPAQLDALWMVFLTTGKVDPIRRLVGELRKRDDVLTVENAKKLGRKLTEAEKKKLVNGLVGRAAEWSLASNAKQHILVGYYLEAMLMRKEYPDHDAAIKLGGMLIKAGLLEVSDKPGGGKVLKSVIRPAGAKPAPESGYSPLGK